jgi:hypothetical protein
MRSGTKVMPAIFFSGTMHTVIIKCTSCIHPSQSLGDFFEKIFFIIRILSGIPRGVFGGVLTKLSQIPSNVENTSITT